MKRLLIAIAVGLVGNAYAQTHVTINGQLDTGLLKQTESDMHMMRNHDNLLRYKGTEELGNGTQAVFNLEHRWDSSDGARCFGNNAIDRLHDTPGVDWQGAANVGIQNPAWGRVLLGRVSNVSGENYSKVDPFIFDGIALSYGNMTVLSASQTPNSIRYDSPVWSGLRINTSYSVGKGKHYSDYNKSYANDGFVLGAVYENSQFFLLADYERIQDSDKSWGWNAAAGLLFDDMTLTFGYHTHKISRAVMEKFFEDEHSLCQDSLTFGIKHTSGRNTFKITFNWARVDSEGDYHGHSKKYGFGYDYALSKHTTLYSILAYVDSSNGRVGRLYNTNGTASDSMTGINFGITHSF
ncbi:MAG: porin [Oxalobacter sp.]|nr:porin [Oxalobacter sp.]